MDDFGFDNVDGRVQFDGGLTPLPFSCPWCGEGNETLFDISGGTDQQYVEDCAVCCRPIVLTISLDEGDNLLSILADPE